MPLYSAGALSASMNRILRISHTHNAEMSANISENRDNLLFL